MSERSESVESYKSDEEIVDLSFENIKEIELSTFSSRDESPGKQ